MARAELLPVRPLPMTREGSPVSAEVGLTGSEPEIVALKLYRTDDKLFVIRLTMSDRPAVGRIEARNAEGMTLFSGKVEAGEVKSEWQAALTVRGEPDQKMIHLPRGTLTWHIVDDDGQEPLEVEAPELIIFPPEGDLSFAPRGLPLELLRDLAATAVAVQAPPGTPPWKALVDKVFQGNPPRYDRENGGSTYYTDLGSPADWNKLTFHLKRYTAARKSPTSRLNCYDAAAYLQVLLRPTYATRYCYMNRFGYLRKTDLIGWGQCNNPFTKRSTLLVVSETSTNRSCFGNHAFCAPSYQGKEYIADACAGPHYQDTPATYVDAAVDSQVPNPARCTRGTVAHIGYYRGVVNVQNLVRVGTEMVHFMIDRPEIPFEENRAKFMRAIGYPSVSELAETPPRAVPDPSVHAASAGWERVYSDLTVGYPETSREWRYARNEESLVLTCWVADGSAMAHQRFLVLGSAHQSDEPIFGPGPEGLGDMSAASLTETPVLIWSQGNVTFRAHTTDPKFDLVAFAFDVARAADERAAPDEVPDIELKRSPSVVRVGEVFTIHVRVEEGTEIDFALSSDHATFERQSGNELTFLARAPGSVQISVAVADTRSLLSAQRTEAVRIADAASDS